MQIALGPSRRVGEGGIPLSTRRAGDIGLFLIWAAQGTATVVSAMRAWERHDLLACAHLTMIAAIVFLSASLFLVRRAAVVRGGGLRPKLVAIAGTWSIIPLAGLPLTWRPDWLLAGTTIGIILVYAFVLWALLTLRRNLSIFPEARRLVRHGPYAVVRHPLYSAHIVTYALIALPRFGGAALILAAVGIAAEVGRARNEEGVLLRAFADYADYAARTPRFIPRLVVGGNHLRLPAGEHPSPVTGEHSRRPRLRFLDW